MLAVIGAIIVILSGYAFLALRIPLDVVAAMSIVGLVMIAGQFVKIQKRSDSSSTPKGEPSGV